MFEPREYEIFLLSETKQCYFFVYYRDIQRQKKVNMLNVLKFVIWKAMYCVYIYVLWLMFFLNIYTFMYVPGSN